MADEFDIEEAKNFKLVDKAYKTMTIKGVKMFFPKLDKPDFNDLKGVDQYRALFVLGDNKSEQFKQVYEALKTMTSSAFSLNGKPAEFGDLPTKNKLLKKQLPQTAEQKKAGKMESSYVGEFYIQLAKLATKGAPPVFDAKKNVLTTDQIAIIGNGSIVNVLMSYGPFLKTGNAGISGVLEAIQIVKAVNYGGISNPESFFDAEATEEDEFGSEPGEEEIPF
jgi:hypothetical protein